MGSMVGFETGAAHGEEGVGGGAVEAAVFEVGGVVGCGGMLAVDAFAGEGVDVEYQMLAKPRGTEEWQLVRDYSPASSAIWNPDARGTYDIRVNVRARGSDVDYDHFNTAQVIY